MADRRRGERGHTCPRIPRRGDGGTQLLGPSARRLWRQGMGPAPWRVWARRQGPRGPDGPEKNLADGRQSMT